MKVKLERVGSTHKNLRTNTVVGTCNVLPKEGYTFEMVSEPLDPEAIFRYIATSEVVAVLAEDPDIIQFKTLNSTYNLYLLEEE